MTSIHNVDQLVLLLREKLNAASRKRNGKSGKAGGVGAPVATARLGPVQKMLDSGDFTERSVRQALVQGILSEEFGDRIVNDVHFQQLVGSVIDIIDSDPAASALLQESLANLRGSKS